MIAVSGFGCSDGFRGSQIELDLVDRTPAQASPGTTPRPDQLPSNVHLLLYAVQEGADRSDLFELVRFEIHPVVDLASPCYIDDGPHVPHPGLHVSQFGKVIGMDTGVTDIANPPASATEEQKIIAATAAQRMANVLALGADGGVRVITSASPGGYPAVAPDCNDHPGLIPPPMCIDADSNARRLAACHAAWAADPKLFEGTDRILTAPLNGSTFGLVDGTNPINLAPVGGAQLFVPDALSTADAYAIYVQTDGMETDPGSLLFYGRATQPLRGASHVHMTSPKSPSLTANLSIFADLGKDDVNF